MESTKKQEDKKPTMKVEPLLKGQFKKSKKGPQCSLAKELMECIAGFEDHKDFLILFRNLLWRNPTFEKMLINELSTWVSISFKF